MNPFWVGVNPLAGDSIKICAPSGVRSSPGERSWARIFGLTDFPQEAIIEAENFALGRLPMKTTWKVLAALLLSVVLLVGCAADGKDGVTPRLRISESTNMWEVSYDNGLTWESLGVKATQDSQTGGSAYRDALAMGYTGTATDFVDLLLGNTTGDSVIESEDGTYIPVPGKSAYEVAVDHGYVGTEEEWLSAMEGTRLEISGDGYWVLDGVKTDVKATAGSGSVEGLDHLFYLQEDYFIRDNETCGNPTWNYTDNVFSGWGGSIGAPETVEAIRFRIRANDKAITKIKVFLTENDKNGTVLYSQTLDVDIQPEQDSYIVWCLPEAYNNTQGKSLYFTYNCDQTCDMWSNCTDANAISSTQHQASATYTANGSQLSSPSKMQNVNGKPKWYLYVELGRVRDVYLYRDDAVTQSQSKVNVFLADRYELVAGDNFQLFYRGVVQAVDPYNYHIRIECEHGKAYPRYFEWNPDADDVGSYTLKLQVRDHNGNLLGEDTTTLVVKQAAAPKQDINVLCIGDSLTSAGVWPAEAFRRLTATNGDPVGNGFSGIHFVGTKTKTLGGVTAGFEGSGGWTWASFLGSKSPFYDADTDTISFKKYCEKNGIDGIDMLCVMLTWNNQTISSNTYWNLEGGHFADARQLLDLLHSEYPDAKVRLMGLQMPCQLGGMGANYGADGGLSDAYGMLVTALHYNAALEQLSKLPQYRDFVSYVDVAGQFDTDYNMPDKSKPVNNRSDVTEVVGTNGLHPSNSGYYQIADAIYRALCHDIIAYFS